MKKIVDILKSKWLKDTGATAILIAVVIVIFLGMNVLVQHLDPTDIDLTPEQLYSLTDETKKIIDAIPKEEEFQIYMFDYEENNPIVELAKQYTKLNENIKVEVLKVEDRPDLVSKYNVEKGYYTVILVSGDRYKTYNYYSFQSVDYNARQVTDLTEQRFTNGLVGISSIGKQTVLYALTGHGEHTFSSDMIYLRTTLELENYEIKTLNILSEQKVPDDCSSLIIASPQKDFTEFETTIINTYIDNGGSIIWFNDPYASSEETPNIKSVLDKYGVTIRQDGAVLEQETSKMALGTPDCIFPSIEGTTITKDIQNVLVLGAGKLEFISDEALQNLGIAKTNLLTTSEKSFFRTNIQNTDRTPAEGEEVGKCVVGAVLEKTNQVSGKVSKLIVFANNTFVTDSAVYAGQAAYPAVEIYDNKALALNSIEYVAEVEEGLTIRKDIKTTYYTPTESQDRIIKIVIFTLPVVVIILGIVIWQLRRRKK